MPSLSFFPLFVPTSPLYIFKFCFSFIVSSLPFLSFVLPLARLLFLFFFFLSFLLSSHYRFLPFLPSIPRSLFLPLLPSKQTSFMRSGFTHFFHLWFIDYLYLATFTHLNPIWTGGGAKIAPPPSFGWVTFFDNS